MGGDAGLAHPAAPPPTFGALAGGQYRAPLRLESREGGGLGVVGPQGHRPHSVSSRERPPPPSRAARSPHPGPARCVHLPRLPGLVGATAALSSGAPGAPSVKCPPSAQVMVLGSSPLLSGESASPSAPLPTCALSPSNKILKEACALTPSRVGGGSSRRPHEAPFLWLGPARRGGLQASGRVRAVPGGCPGARALEGSS